MDSKHHGPSVRAWQGKPYRAYFTRRVLLLRQRYYAFRRVYLDPFVFIHINKTGGSSISTALRLPIEHKTAAEKIAQIGARRWDRRFTFTFS